MISGAFRNGLWGGLASAISAILGIAGAIIIVRSLTPQAYGELSYYLWLSSVLSILGCLSLPVAITKITAELRGSRQPEEAHALICWVFLVVILINLLIGGILLFISAGRPSPQQYYLFLIAGIPVTNGCASVLRSMLMGRERYLPVALAVIISAGIQFGLVLFVNQVRGGLIGFLISNLSLFFLQAAVLLLYVWKQTGFHLWFHPPRLPRISTWQRYFTFAAPAALVLFFETVVWQRSEIFFLEKLSSIDQVGFYNLGYTAFGTFLVMGWAVINGYYPAISCDYGAHAWDQIQEKASQGMILAALFAVPLCFGGWVIMPRLVPIFFGQKMMAAAQVAQILFLGILPGTLAGMLSLTMNAIGGIWYTVCVGGVISLVNIGLDIWFIPRFGAAGAAMASTSAQFFYTFLLVLLLHIFYKIEVPWRILVAISSIGVLTTLVMPTIIQTWVPGALGLLSAICLAGTAYTLVILASGYLKIPRTTRGQA